MLYHKGCAVLSLFSVRLFVTLWTVACQPPLSIRFSRQEYWSELPFPSPGDFPHPRIEPTSLCLLHWQEGSLPRAPPGKPHHKGIHCLKVKPALTFQVLSLMNFDFSPSTHLIYHVTLLAAKMGNGWLMA